MTTQIFPQPESIKNTTILSVLHIYRKTNCHQASKIKNVIKHLLNVNKSNKTSSEYLNMFCCMQDFSSCPEKHCHIIFVTTMLFLFKNNNYNHITTHLNILLLYTTFMLLYNLIFQTTDNDNWIYTEVTSEWEVSPL